MFWAHCLPLNQKHNHLFSTRSIFRTTSDSILIKARLQYNKEPSERARVREKLAASRGRADAASAHRRGRAQGRKDLLRAGGSSLERSSGSRGRPGPKETRTYLGRRAQPGLGSSSSRGRLHSSGGHLRKLVPKAPVQPAQALAVSCRATARSRLLAGEGASSAAAAAAAAIAPINTTAPLTARIHPPAPSRPYPLAFTIAAPSGAARLLSLRLLFSAGPLRFAFYGHGRSLSLLGCIVRTLMIGYFIIPWSTIAFAVLNRACYYIPICLQSFAN